MFAENFSEKSKNGYYLGVDIGTDSVGYAVTDRDYSLCRFKGEPMTGVALFDKADQCADRRAHETGRNLVCRLLLEKKQTNATPTTCLPFTIPVTASPYSSGLLYQQ